METIEIKTESPKFTDDDCREFINPYYLEKLQKRECQEVQQYISNLSDSDYKFNEDTEFGHYDGYDDKNYEKYRSCRIHYPQDDTILPCIGK